MIDTTSLHPFAACTKFAIEFLDRIAVYDLAGAEGMIDANDSGSDFALHFPKPVGFTYCPSNAIKNWMFLITGSDPEGFAFDFEVPFLEREFRPMQARFSVRRIGQAIQVRFHGLVAT